MDIKCNKTICKFNNCYCCEAKEIHVAQNAECKTFNKDKHKKNLQDVSRDMFEAAPEIAPFRHSKNIDIVCNAQCLFNVNGVCNANGITVLEGKNIGRCGTFIKR